MTTTTHACCTKEQPLKTHHVAAPLAACIGASTCVIMAARRERRPAAALPAGIDTQCEKGLGGWLENALRECMLCEWQQSPHTSGRPATDAWRCRKSPAIMAARRERPPFVRCLQG